MSSVGSSSQRVPVSFNTNQQSVSGQIESKNSELSNAFSRLASLNEALAGIQDPPQPTGEGRGFERAMTAWREACAANERQRDQIRGQIQGCENDIRRIQG